MLQEKVSKKKESFLSVNTSLATGFKSWQTLGKTTKSQSQNNDESLKTTNYQYYEEGGQGAGIPLSPTNTTKDTHNSLATYNASLHTRGQEVLLVFSMQGVGIFVNSLVLTFLLAVTRKKNDGDQEADDEDRYYYSDTTLLNYGESHMPPELPF